MVQMEYEAYDSDGTEDDLPPSPHSRISRGAHTALNGRSTLGTFPYPRVHEMETQIHLLEREAYSGVLRAFRAQADAITWDKEGLISELRKELRVSDDEHRELLTRVNYDDIIEKIREWRLAEGNQMITHYPSQPVHGIVLGPTISAPTPRKKQKTSQLISSGDIRWDGEDPGVARQERYVGQSFVNKKSQSFGRSTLATGRGGGCLKSPSRRELLPLQNGIGEKVLDGIELLNTDALVKEVETVFSSNNLDPFELEKAKKMLREHEQALVDAIAKLAYVSDGEREEERPNIQCEVVEREEEEVEVDIV